MGTNYVKITKVLLIKLCPETSYLICMEQNKFIKYKIFQRPISTNPQEKSVLTGIRLHFFWFHVVLLFDF